MKTADLLNVLNAEVVNLANGEREVTAGYAGDFLSFVMGKAPADSAWFTVMTNVNVAAVAALADVAVVVICEGSKPDAALTERAKQQGINILTTKMDIFGAIERFLFFSHKK